MEKTVLRCHRLYCSFIYSIWFPEDSGNTGEYSPDRSGARAVQGSLLPDMGGRSGLVALIDHVYPLSRFIQTYG